MKRALGISLMVLGQLIVFYGGWVSFLGFGLSLVGALLHFNFFRELSSVFRIQTGHSNALSLKKDLVEIAAEARKGGLLGLDSLRQQIQSPELKEVISWYSMGMDPAEIVGALKLKAQSMSVQAQQKEDQFQNLCHTIVGLGAISMLIIFSADPMSRQGFLPMAVSLLLGPVFFGAFRGLFVREAAHNAEVYELLAHASLTILSAGNPQGLDKRLSLIVSR